MVKQLPSIISSSNERQKNLHWFKLLGGIVVTLNKKNLRLWYLILLNEAMLRNFHWSVIIGNSSILLYLRRWYMDSEEAPQSYQHSPCVSHLCLSLIATYGNLLINLHNMRPPKSSGSNPIVTCVNHCS